MIQIFFQDTSNTDVRQSQKIQSKSDLKIYALVRSKKKSN